MHQIACWLGLRRRPHCGSLQHSPSPLSGLGVGPLGEGEGGRGGGREGEGRGKEGREGKGEGKGEEGMRGEAGHPQIFG